MELLLRLAGWLASGGVLGLQMPGPIPGFDHGRRAPSGRGRCLARPAR
jgi:hypothetical protein